MMADAAFSAASAIMVPLYGLLALAPRSRAARALAASPTVPAALAAAYACLLAQHCLAAPGGGALGAAAALLRATVVAPWPLVDVAGAVAGLAALFSDAAFTAAVWLHLLALDFCQAQAVFLDGASRGVPTPHSVLLCFMFGPLGLLSHAATCAALEALRSVRARRRAG